MKDLDFSKCTSYKLNDKAKYEELEKLLINDNSLKNWDMYGYAQHGHFHIEGKPSEKLQQFINDNCSKL